VKKIQISAIMTITAGILKNRLDIRKTDITNLLLLSKLLMFLSTFKFEVVYGKTEKG